MDLRNPSATTYKMQLQEPTKMLCNFLHFYCAINKNEEVCSFGDHVNDGWSYLILHPNVS